MIRVTIIIDPKGTEGLPKKIRLKTTDISFFKEGGIIDFPRETIKSNNYTRIKVKKVRKEIKTGFIPGLFRAKIELIVYAERCF